jgi:hypothetical protein
MPRKQTKNSFFFQYHAGVYILENNPPPRGGKQISAHVMWRKKYEKGEEKKGENVKEKGRKGKENEKRGSKRVK